MESFLVSSGYTFSSRLRTSSAVIGVSSPLRSSPPLISESEKKSVIGETVPK